MNKPDMLSIQEVPKSDIPTEAERVFMAYGLDSTMMSDISLSEFDHFLRIDGMGVTSYLAEHEKLPALGGAERTTYILDIDNQLNTPVGMGEMRLNVSSASDYFKDKPFVGYTRTYDKGSGHNFQRRGYGLRRLHALNVAARTLYELPLHSDTNRSPEATRLWQHLVRDNLAESYKQGTAIRYKFY